MVIGQQLLRYLAHSCWSPRDVDLVYGIRFCLFVNLAIAVVFFINTKLFFPTVCCKQALLLLWDDELKPLKLSKPTHLQPVLFNWFNTEDIIKLHHSELEGRNKFCTTISNQGSVSLSVFLVALHYMGGCCHVSISSVWNNSRLETSPGCRLAPGPHGKLWKAFHRMSQAYSDRANKTKTKIFFAVGIVIYSIQYIRKHLLVTYLLQFLGGQFKKKHLQHVETMLCFLDCIDY